MLTESACRTARLSDRIPRAFIQDHAALCPNCRKKLCYARLGGKATGIILWCKGCKSQVMLEIE